MVRLHDTYSRSFQRPFGHTINSQPNEHDTQLPEIPGGGAEFVGVRGGRWVVGGGGSEEEGDDEARLK